MARSLIDKIIYSITRKPQYYVEVKNPPKTAREKLTRPKEARQIQYNKWSKHHQVYSGSYLPYQSRELENKLNKLLSDYQIPFFKTRDCQKIIELVKKQHLEKQ